MFVNKSLENLINEARQELMEERERDTFVDDDDDEVYMDMVTNNNSSSDKMNNAKLSFDDYLDMNFTTTSLNIFSH